MIKRLSFKLQEFAFATQQKGTVAIEFALSLPIWIALLIGSTDSSYMMIVSQRVDRIAYSITDIITQSETISHTDLDNIMLAAGQLMQPFSFAEDGVVIVSSVYKPSGAATIISWQYVGGGSLARGSKIGVSGGTPTLPGDLVLNDNENIIITEVYYLFKPMFINAGILSEGDIYRVAIYKPRLSPLITPPT
ncbi:MAG: pilus assembly protein [Alphaproteobacteria bacterium]|nr:pilus assembly protein [Alphaproteobacteria bacterium]